MLVIGTLVLFISLWEGGYAERPEQQAFSIATPTRAHKSTHTYEQKTPAQDSISPKVAVCITGQLGRLEHTSKVENLLKTLTSEVHVFVAVTGGEAHYSYYGYHVGGSIRYNESNFHTEMKAKFGSFYHGGCLKARTDWTTKPHLLDHWKVYRTDDKTETARKKRLTNHFNQFQRASDCFGVMSNAEHAMQTNYTTVIKLRDDSVVLKPMTRLPQAASEYLVVKDCAGWGGIEDKVAIMPRAYADDYLQGPFEFQMSVLNSVPEAINISATLTNSEKMLKKVLELRHVQVRAASAEGFPVVDGRPGLDRQSFCVLPTSLDCHPQEPWEMGAKQCTAEEMRKKKKKNPLVAAKRRWLAVKRWLLNEGGEHPLTL